MEDVVIREKLIAFAQEILRDPRIHQQGGNAVWETIKVAITPSFFSHHQVEPSPHHHTHTHTPAATATAAAAATKKAAVPVAAPPVTVITPAKKPITTPASSSTSSSSPRVSHIPVLPSLPAGTVIPPPIPHSNSMPPSELLKPIHLPRDDTVVITTPITSSSSSSPATAVASPVAAPATPTTASVVTKK